MSIHKYLSTLNPTKAGKFLYYFLPYRKKVILENMSQVFGDTLSFEEKRLLAQCFYSHLAASIRENLAMRFMSEEAIGSQAEVVGHEKVIEIAKKHGGVLILTGHFGNWEFAPIAGILNFKQFQGKFYFIRKTLRPKWLEKIIFQRYYRSGLNVIPKKNSLSQVCAVLENQHAVVFVMDQHASLASKDGVLVPFFGKKAATYRSLATIARYTNIPVVPAASYRKLDGKHVLAFYDPISWHASESGSRHEIEQNTLLYNQALEKLVLAHPEQWLWTHRRWK